MTTMELKLEKTYGIHETPKHHQPAAAAADPTETDKT